MMENQFGELPSNSMFLCKHSEIESLAKLIPNPECVSSGRTPILSLQEESRTVDHLKLVAQYGYGYTRSEVAVLANDYAVQIGKRNRTDVPFSRRWLDGFFSRWPELKVLRPRSLELARAKSASADKVNLYFANLSSVMEKYQLKDKPHLIFNVDEKGISPNHTPPSIVAPTGCQPPAVTTGKASTTTVLGCGNASGMATPPYFIFPGKRWVPKLLQGGSPGISGTVSETGWSNSEIFRDYLENHFSKYAPPHNETPLLLLLDGHSTPSSAITYYDQAA